MKAMTYDDWRDAFSWYRQQPQEVLDITHIKELPIGQTVRLVLKGDEFFANPVVEVVINGVSFVPKEK